jgi:hypothetical protein
MQKRYALHSGLEKGWVAIWADSELGKSNVFPGLDKMFLKHTMFQFALDTEEKDYDVEWVELPRFFKYVTATLDKINRFVTLFGREAADIQKLFDNILADPETDYYIRRVLNAPIHPMDSSSIEEGIRELALFMRLYYPILNLTISAILPDEGKDHRRLILTKFIEHLKIKSGSISVLMLRVHRMVDHTPYGVDDAAEAFLLFYNRILPLELYKLPDDHLPVTYLKQLFNGDQSTKEA